MVATSSTAPAVFIAAPRVDRRTHLHPGPTASMPGRVERPVLRLKTATEVPAQRGGGGPGGRRGDGPDDAVVDGACPRRRTGLGRSDAAVAPARRGRRRAGPGRTSGP